MVLVLAAQLLASCVEGCDSPGELIMQDYGGSCKWRRAGGLFQAGRDEGQQRSGSSQRLPTHQLVQERERKVPGGQGALRIMQERNAVYTNELLPFLQSTFFFPTATCSMIVFHSGAHVRKQIEPPRDLASHYCCCSHHRRTSSLSCIHQ